MFLWRNIKSRGEKATLKKKAREYTLPDIKVHYKVRAIRQCDIA